jgi:CelD/BcsL family acetyltransferase involved in cellulose biosynthesis
MAEGRPPRAHEFVRIGINRDIESLETDWLAFQERAAGTVFQTYQWCRLWLEAAGRGRGVDPVIVTGRDPAGRLLFLLPFSMRRLAGVKVLEWLGGQQMTYGFGLYDHGFLRHAGAWFAAQGWSILDQTGADAVALAEMPAVWRNVPHPLASWFSVEGPNRSYVMQLGTGFDALLAAKRSAETRRGNRKRDQKLEKLGRVAFGLPADRAQAHRLIDEMFDQQRERLAESGIHGVFTADERRFIHRLIDMPDHLPPLLQPYHLIIDGKLEAMTLVACHGGGFWALISSLGSPQYRKLSPGDYTLRRTIAAAIEQHQSFLDLAAGSFSYKQAWADEEVRLHYAIRGLTLRGYAFALMRTAYVVSKRTIKQTPILWTGVNWLKRRLAGKPSQLG